MATPTSRSQPQAQAWARQPHGLVVALLGLALAWLPPGACAQNAVGALYLANRATGAHAFAYIDLQGQFQQTYEIPGHPTSEVLGLTHMVSTPNGFLLYNADTGQAVVIGIAHTGYPYIGNYYAFSPGWQHIVPLGDSLFFYQGDGSGALGYITPEGQFVQRRSYAPGTFASWSHITATDNHLFFYNRDLGAVAVAAIDASYDISQTHTVTTGALADLSYLVTTGPFVLLYSQATGTAVFGMITHAGQYELLEVLDLPAGYNKLVRHDRFLVLYNSNAGGGTVGYVERYGALGVPEFIVTQEPPFSAGWTRIVSTKEDVLFYNSVTGLAAVGHLDHAGQFQQTHTLTLATGWGFIAAGAR